MANSTEVAESLAAPPQAEQVKKVEQWARESLVQADETIDAALAPGTARRRAFEAALKEIEAGATSPSVGWRHRYSLLLGLERLLSSPEPRLADGTKLSDHQVDALSGTLVALTAEAEDWWAAEEELARQDGDVAGGADEDALELAGEAGEVEVAEPSADGVDGESAAEFETELLEDGEAEQEEWKDEAEAEDWDRGEDGYDEQVEEAEPEDQNARRRFWFEHATGAGKTVAALGFAEASRTGGILILTHRRNLVDQFLGELRDRGYKERISPAMLGDLDSANGPVTVETYQWFVRNAGNISDAYSIVVCDEAHTALGEKTSRAIRAWHGPIFIGMTATGALIARHVNDLFPTQTSRFDLAQAARRGVIVPIRCIRISPGTNVRTLANVPLRRGEVDQDFDQEELAALLDQAPLNTAVADLYRARFKGLPGVVYSAGVRHAYNVAEAFREAGVKAKAVSGETPKRQLTEILSAFEHGEFDVLVNAMLLAEGWNSPRATVCMHLAPTASRRVYQQRVGRVTRRAPGKEAGIVIDFVHPGTTHDEPIVTLHKLLGRDVYRGGAIVVGPVRRSRGRRVRVERRVLPVTDDPERRARVFERELWRIAVENLPYSEQHVWAALAGARATPNVWRRAKAMMHKDPNRDLRRRFLLTCAQRNRNSALRIRSLSEVAQLRDTEAFDDAVEIVGTWSREERRDGASTLLQALADKRIGSREQATAWVWRLAEFSREAHEAYALQRWPETKRLLGLLVNSSGVAHARNARRLVEAARQQDRRLTTALLAAALAHSPEAEEVLRAARIRMARKPSALARELARNFPRRRNGKRRKRNNRKQAVDEAQLSAAVDSGAAVVGDEVNNAGDIAAADNDNEAVANDALDGVPYGPETHGEVEPPVSTRLGDPSDIGNLTDIGEITDLTPETELPLEPGGDLEDE